MRYSNFLNSFSINDLLYKVLKHKNKDSALRRVQLGWDISDKSIAAFM